MARSSAAFTSLAALILAAQAAMGAPRPSSLEPSSLEPSSLEECQAQLARSPDGEAPALCLHELATGTGPFRKAAAQRLQELAAQHPERPWLLIYLGRVKWQNREGADAVAELYTAAARVAARRGMAEAELIARWGLCRILRDTGRLDEEEAQVERAARIAESSGLPRLRLRADILRALHWSARGEFEQAYLTLRRIQAAVEREGSYPLLRDHLFALAKTARQMGRLAETRNAYRLAMESAAAAGDPAWESQARYGLLTVSMAELAETPSATGRRQLLELARRAWEAARSAGTPFLEAQPLWMLGVLDGDAEAAKAHLRLCAEVADTLWQRSFCRSAYARRVAATDPRAAEAIILEALTLAQQSGDVQARTASWSQRMRVSWASSPPEKAFADSRAALDAIEALRDLQGGTAGQPGLFSTWADHYHWLSGRLLEAGQLERAFGVMERMRSRTLIDALGLSGPGSPALQARRADLFVEIARLQRRLLEAGTEKKELDRATAEIGRLELEEAALRARIAEADPAYASLRPPRFASLEQVRGALEPDEALLAFQVAPWTDFAGDFGGGSWLLVSTRSATRAYRLPDRTRLRDAVTAFTGMFGDRKGAEAQGAATLYRELLAPALAGLPGEIRRLVIVPDDALHRLPFAALRPQPGSGPLATRYEITLALSATLWLRWREARPAPAETPALVFADPLTLATGEGAGKERSATFLAPARGLGRLPFARAEGKAVLRQLGGELLMGKDASEAYLKKHGAGAFGLLHFAAHAVTNELNPDGSGVYLSPGDPKEDGLLQAREIVDLNLEGRIVVLSTCESASGEILRGEGVMGLARAFFQAGAHTVVASLWPLRDDEGAALFDRFYRHLGQGRSVAAALQAAQRDRMEAGAPAVAWAGVVVLGDGDRVPVPGGRGPGWAVWLAAAVLASVIGLLLWRRIAGARSRRSAR
ncbi:MAG: CHAT domain-containing protein [Thermoanaerobaculia bacterium]